jgi:NDP-sugar pyrophosphorylase family protein
MNIVIPMAGLGSRFPRDKFYLPKPLIDVNSKPMIQRAIESLDIDGQYYFTLRNDEFLDIQKDVISKIVKDPVFITVDKTTEGPACSVLLFKDYINTDEELVTANCDQVMDWSSKLFFHNVRLYDGAVVTYYSDTDKNSYVKLDRTGRAVQFAEKEVISNISLNGIHYWKRGSDFVASAEAMIAANDRAPNGEFYISVSYNYMISQGLECGIFHIPNECHHAVGVPVDLERFLKYDKA